MEKKRRGRGTVTPAIIALVAQTSIRPLEGKILLSRWPKSERASTAKLLGRLIESGTLKEAITLDWESDRLRAGRALIGVTFNLEELRCTKGSYRTVMENILHASTAWNRIQPPMEKKERRHPLPAIVLDEIVSSPGGLEDLIIMLHYRDLNTAMRYEQEVLHHVPCVKKTRLVPIEDSLSTLSREREIEEEL